MQHYLSCAKWVRIVDELFHISIFRKRTNPNLLPDEGISRTQQ